MYDCLLMWNPRGTESDRRALMTCKTRSQAGRKISLGSRQPAYKGRVQARYFAGHKLKVDSTVGESPV